MNLSEIQKVGIVIILATCGYAIVLSQQITNLHKEVKNLSKEAAAKK